MQDRKAQRMSWLQATLWGVVGLGGLAAVLLSTVVGHFLIGLYSEVRTHADLKRLVGGDTSVRLASLTICDGVTSEIVLTDPEALAYLGAALASAKQGVNSARGNTLKLSFTNGTSAPFWVEADDEAIVISICNHPFGDSERYLAHLPKPMPASFATVHRFLRTGEWVPAN
jgi:hypothetical protein